MVTPSRRNRFACRLSVFFAAISLTLPSIAATLADLTPQNISISGSPVNPGGSITVSYKVANIGGTNAIATQTKIQIKSPSNVLVTAPTFSTAAVSASSSVKENRSVTIPSGSAAGTYCAYVIVDNQSQVTQSNYANDLSSCVTFTVQSLATIPGAPQNLSASPGNGQVGLGWNPPSSNGGATITGYRVFRGSSSANTLIVTSGGCANLGAVTSCTDTGVTNGQSYYYIVSAVNSAGQGPPSNGATATPAGASLPSAPRNLAASAGNGQVGLGWTVPSSNGGAAITSYRVFRGSSSSNTLIVTSGGCANLGAVTSCTDTGLTNGQSYYYIVSAVNSAGQGPPSNGVTATPAGSATPADIFPQSISISGAPVNPGGTITVNYTITNSGGTPAPASHTKIQVKDQANVQVAAPIFSTAGIGANSSITENRAVTIPAGSSTGTYCAYVIVDNTQSEVVQSNYTNDLSSCVSFSVQSGATIPGAPQNLSASAGNGQVGLGWNPPASNGGAAITSYRVFRGSSSANTLIVTSGGCANLGAVTSCTDTGLTNGQSYYYIVSAVNSVGQGAPSNGATATPATGTTIPGAPRNLTAAPGNGQNGLAWTAPSSNGGATITSYRVFRGSNSSNTLIVTSGGCASLGAVLSCTDTGLTNGQSYYYIVSALNNVGQGPPSNGVTATPAGSTGQKPAAFSLSGSAFCTAASTRAVALSWTNSTGVASYSVLRDSLTIANTLPSSQTALDDASVAPGVTYSYVVRATNSSGSTDSNAINVFVPSTSCSATLQPPTPLEPGSSSEPGIVIASTTPTLKWSSPGAADGYAVTIEQQLNGPYTSILTTDPSALIGGTSFNVPSGRLTDGNYRWSVRAHGGSGFTSPGGPLYFRVAQSTPSCSLSCRATVASTAGVNSPVSFSAAIDTTCGGTPAVQWTFGDAGSGATTTSASHTYKQAGTFPWTLSVNAGGQSCSRSGSIVIAPAAVPVLSGKVYDVTTSKGVKATVTVGNWQTVSGDDGLYELRNVAAGEFTASITKSGYVTSTVTVSIPAGSAGTNHDFPIQPVPPPASPPTILSVTGPYKNFVHYVDTHSFVQTVKVSVGWSNHPPGVVWFRPSQGGAFSVGTADTVTHSFDMGKDFGNCGKLYVDATALDGATSKRVQAPFIVMSDPLNFFGLSLPAARSKDSGGNFYYSTIIGLNFPTLKDADKGVRVPDWVPVFGKENLAMRLAPSVEATISSDGSAEFELASDGAFTNAPKKAKPFLKMAGIDWSFDPSFTLNGQYVDARCRWDWEGGAGLTGSLEFSKSWPFTLGVVPVYFKVTIAAEPSGHVVIGGSNDSFALSGDIGIAIRARMTGGLGFNEILNAEVYLQGDGSATWLPGKSPFYEIRLGVKVGVEAHAWIFKYGTGLYEYKWKFPDPNAVLAPIEHATTVPRLIERDYLLRPDYALFAGGRRSQRAVSTSARPRVSVHDVQTNVFPFSQPSIAAAGDKVDLIWLHDDPKRTAVNRTVAVFSTGTPDALDAPRAISDDGTADFHPRIAAFADGTAVAAWENANRTFDDNVTPDQMSAAMEIATASWNPLTGQWSAAEAMTHNGYVDYSPRLTGRESGNLLLLWIANPANDLTGSQSKPNELWYARRTAGAWSSPQKLATMPYAINRYDVAFDGAAAQAVISVDVDGDLTTADDHELFLTRYDGGSWSPLQQLTHDAVADDSPAIAILPDGGRLLIWLRGENLVSARDFDTANASTIATPGYASTVAAYRLASNAAGALALVWSDPSSHGSDLFAIRYDPTIKAWGTAEQLTNDEETEKYAAAVMNAKGDLVVLCDRGAVQQQGSTVSADAIVQPETDLALVLQRTETDLAMAAVTVSPATPPPGSVATLTASVANRGSVGIAGADVAFYAGALRPDAVIARGHLPAALPPGASADVTVDWTVPAASLPGTIIAVIDPDHLLPDADTSNNSNLIVLALPDLTIDSIRYEARGDSTFIAARVVNSGNAPAGATSVLFHRDTVNGALIAAQQIPALDVGASIDLTLDVATQPREVWVVVDEPNAIAESNETNNIRHFEIAPENTNNRRRSSPPPLCNTSSFRFSTFTGETPADGGRQHIDITSSLADCTWTASASVPWIQIVDGSSGKGNGTVTFDVAKNEGSVQRTGSLVIAGWTFIVVQAGRSLDVTITLPGGVLMSFVRVPAGNFLMGSPLTERGRTSSETPHRVTITRDFLIGKYEVTEQQWSAVMSGGNTRLVPQVGITWNDVAGPNGFITRLNNYLASSNQSSIGTVRLPTEAEWEYAGRGGTQTRFPWGDALDCADDCSACATLDPHLWWCGNAQVLHQVGTKTPNSLDIHDMNGNVFEWVNDWAAGISTADAVDPKGPASGTQRIIRGGGFSAKANECRSAQRWGGDPTAYVSGATGVRIAMTLK